MIGQSRVSVGASVWVKSQSVWSSPACSQKLWLPNSSERMAFCKRGLEGAVDRHDLAGGLHLGADDRRSPEANLSNGQRGILTTT